MWPAVIGSIPAGLRTATAQRWYSRCTVPFNHPAEGLPSGDEPALPRRRSGISRTVTLEARPELRDRETYYAQLRYAVHCQSRDIHGVGWTPNAPDTWT